jgi:hypothetical protein
MFRQLLLIHWKGLRFGLLPFILLAFGLPLVVVQGLYSGTLAERQGAALPQMVLSGVSMWAPLFPLLATVTGATIALSAWTWDHRAGHVYALSLPLPRWRYVMMKMGAGALLLLIPCLALWLGALIASSAAEIPEGLRAYPTALAFRFLLTSLVLYGLLFALAAGTMRTALWILGTFLFVLFFGGTITGFLGHTLVPSLEGWSFLDRLGDAMLYWPGPFDVITGSWMLIDV